MKKFAQTKLSYGNPKGNFWFIDPEEDRRAANSEITAIPQDLTQIRT